MTENSLFSGDALPKIKWSTIRAMGYCSKFWRNSPSTLQLHDWLGRGRYPCRILAFLDWNFKKKQRIFYCNRPSCLLGCTIKPSPTTENSGHWLSSSKKKKNVKFSIVFKKIKNWIKVRRKKKKMLRRDSFLNLPKWTTWIFIEAKSIEK